MARPASTQTLVSSIFDRLVDLNPSAKDEVTLSRSQILTELRESVRRDLENLLNTRKPCLEIPGDFKELEYSVINYGIPDFSGMNIISDREKERFRQQLEKTIAYFEPRFKSVHVELLDSSSEIDRTLHFRIDAMLNIQSTIKPIVFDSRMEPITHNFKVRDLDSD